MSVLLALVLIGVSVRARVQAPNCAHTVSGYVYDEHDDTPLDAAAVYLEGSGAGTYTDETGYFELAGLCTGTDTLRVTHIGCLPVEMAVEVGEGASAKTLRVTLEHHAELLAGATVHAHRNLTGVSDPGGSLSGEQLNRSAGEDFATVLTSLPGVRQVGTGANVGRPLVDGLGGARLQVVQGGIALATQDWGDEHALEIDPFGTENIQLARGGATVRYGASRTGATLVLDDQPMPEAKGLHGQALGFGGSNNKSVGAGTHVAQRLSEHWGYRAMAYGTSAGDARTPDYVLSNTGERRASGHARVYYADTTLKLDLGYRVFGQETGILRAAHVGNLSDLERALESDRPLVVNPYTRKIDAPRQDVLHHWLTANAGYALHGGAGLTLSYGGQLNRRREYDVRRGGRSATPSLDLSLTTHDIRAQYDHRALPGDWRGDVGVQSSVATNVNVEGTGVRPLIPYYTSETVGLYAEERHPGERWSLETSLRADRRRTRAEWFVVSSEPGGFTRYTFDRAEWLGAASLGAARYFAGGSSLRARLALSSRSPNPAERFANGIHTALAVLERGDTSLRVERSAKGVLAYGFEPGASAGGGKVDGVELHVSGFAQVVADFIYQQVEAEPELTIQGAFPVYLYRQGDAILSGVDADLHAPIGPLRASLEASYLRGTLRGGGGPLPDIAPLRLAGELAYAHTSNGVFKDYRFALNVAHVAEQRRLPATVLRAAPPGYTLLGAELSGHIALAGKTLGVQLTSNNLFDVSYRDYLDRLRYYAARPGRDVQLRLLYDF